MGLFDRVSRVVRSNLGAMVSAAEDPEKILEQSVTDMQEDLIQMRQAVAQAMASQKRLQQKYNQAQTEANEWQRRAQLALTKGDENLAREALTRKKTNAEVAAGLKSQVDGQTAQLDTLKRNLVALESKISEAKTKKDMLSARARAAKATEQINQVMGNMNTGSSMAAFERMEDKVLQMEARSEAVAELAGDNLEKQFAMLESGSDVDADLLALKEQMALSAGGTPKGALPQAAPQDTSKNSVVDAELEQLRAELEKG
ncbi:PspA/IM30 family protein [Leptolyngbya sp. FACHB-261]|uniref:PspA/IM30 family protein n=1 Tax=Leptolyngbya sp. FACHB-261 TaxID=2692806 RepID=UPI0016867F4D|nr:PspA/IM30 family protein [Leptolyngbya sp. FACHB-261]MBD2099517.1 PspA/IM30 family protein [Leptolyngbya sp. FACHB-261]